MMLIVPINTDAPIYHWPFVTVGLIVVTSLAFVAEVLLPYEAFEHLLLQVGVGLHPLQWLTFNFLHLDIFHLAGNMIFLWTYGLVVEGKIGPWRFLASYLGIGVLSGALIQFLLRNAEVSEGLGASCVIYGMLAIAMVWAPVNDMSCFYLFWIGFRIFTGVKEWPIWGLSTFFILLNLIVALFTGIQMSSELGHSVGAFWGLTVGIAYLKFSWVDCEEWDAWTLLKKRYGPRKFTTPLDSRPLDRQAASAAKKRRKKRERDETMVADELPDEARIADAHRRIRAMLDQGLVDGALKAHLKSAQRFPSWRLAEADHVDLIKGLHDDKAWAESVPLMRDFIAHHPEKAVRMRLRLAQVLIRELGKPTNALEVLSRIEADSLPPDLETARRRLFDKAQAMLAEGILEVEGDD